MIIKKNKHTLRWVKFGIARQASTLQFSKPFVILTSHRPAGQQLNRPLSQQITSGHQASAKLHPVLQHSRTESQPVFCSTLLAYLPTSNINMMELALNTVKQLNFFLHNDNDEFLHELVFPHYFIQIFTSVSHINTNH